MSALTLAAAGTIAGSASANTSITITIFGGEKATADSYPVLYQGVLTTIAAVLYTTPSSTSTVISTIVLANTSGAPVTATVFVGGTGNGNRIKQVVVPAGGDVTWAGDGWTAQDANGGTSIVVPITLTGDVTGTGSGSIATTIAANAVTTAKVINDAIDNTKLANMADATFKMRALGAGTGDPIDGTPVQAKTALAIVPVDVSGFDTQVRTSRLDQMAAPTADVSMNGHKITNILDATNAQDVPSFTQVQSIAEGRKDKDAVEWTTTGNITLSGLGTQGGGEWTGTLAVTDRILVKDQSSSAADGIYTPAAGAWARTADANTGAEITGASVLVKQGANSKGDTWRQSATVTTIGTDPQTWVQIGEGDPISLTNVGAVPNAQGASLSGQALTLQPANGSFPGLLSAAGFTNLGNQSGTNTGNVSLGAVGASPNANAATLTGQALNLELASASFPGVISSAQFTKLANTTNTNSGDVTLTAVGASPNANSASLSGQALTIQPASASFPGVITSAQFVILSNTSGTNSGNVSLGAVGASPNANGLTLTGQALNAELASASFPGMITAAQFTKLANTSGTNTGDQTFTASGDATAPGSTSNLAMTLATVNSNVGSFGDANHVGTFTVNGKGLTTAAGTATIQPMQGWIDVTLAATPVLTGNTGAQNITAINAILAAAAAGSTIYFPGGTYNFNAKISVPGKQFTFQGQGSQLAGGYTILAWNANVGDDLILLTNAIWYSQFRDLTFVSAGVTQSAGAVVNINGNAGTNFFNCSFSTTGGGFLFDVLKGDKVGSGIQDQSWNSSIISGCIMNGFKSRGIFVNSAASSLVVDRCVINGAWGGFTGSPSALQAVAGIEGRWVGALQIIGCDILGCINNLLSDPVAANSESAASIFCTNTYFDNAGGSCIKFSGTGGTVRSRFDTCSFTTAGTNYSTPGTNLSAVELAGTFAYSANGQGIDFVNCNALNTFATTGTTNGFLITNAADFSVTSSRVAGWTNGMNATPIATAGRTRPQITGCTVGPTTDFAGNSVGLLFNAGAATYGSMVVTGNNVVGNTSAPITDNSAVGPTDSKLFSNNAGYMDGAGQLPLLSSGGAAVIAGRGAVTSGTAETLLFTSRIPGNGTRANQNFRVKMKGQSSSTGTLIFRFRVGAAGTTADTVIWTMTTSAAQVANQYADVDGLITVAAIGNPGSVAGSARAIVHLTILGETVAAEVLAAPNTTAAWFISVTGTCSVGTFTVRQASVEAL